MSHIRRSSLPREHGLETSKPLITSRRLAIAGSIALAGLVAQQRDTLKDWYDVAVAAPGETFVTLVERLYAATEAFKAEQMRLVDVPSELEHDPAALIAHFQEELRACMAAQDGDSVDFLHFDKGFTITTDGTLIRMLNGDVGLWPNQNTPSNHIVSTYNAALSAACNDTKSED